MGRLDYLKQYSSESTVRSYESALKAFFEMVHGERENLEVLADRYFVEGRDYEADVQNFMVRLKGLAPKSVKLKLSAVRVFLIENEVDLPQRFWRRLRSRVKGSRALTIDKVPGNAELRSIISHLPEHGRALFLTLASSGMRIGEALQLKIGDLELDQESVKVNIRGEYTKSGNPRMAFVSREAKEAIEEWMKVRDEYLEAAAGKSHLYDKSAEDSRLFPFLGTTARIVWNSALQKAGHGKRDSSTNRRMIHPDVLRKFFRTKMGSVIPVDVVEALMGHEGYLNEVYRRYSIEDLAKFYKQGEHALLIFTEATEVTKLRQEIEEKNRQLQTLVNGLTTENLEMKNRLNQLKIEFEEHKKTVQELKDALQKLIS